MLIQVFIMLGLAWVAADERVEITPAGNKFLTSPHPGGVLSDQMSKFQFWNPSVASVTHKAVKLHSLPFLGETLRSVDGQKITAVEYTIFVSRAKAFADVDRVVDLIERFRALPDDMKALVVSTCDSYKLSGIRRSSIYNTIRLGRSYAIRMFALSRLLETNDDGGLSIRKGALKHYRSYLAEYVREGTYIEFENEKDWIAFFGDPEAKPVFDTALEYYAEKGNVAAAVATKKKTTKNAKEVADFRDMIVSEKSLEDYLEKNLDVVGSKIGAKLKLIGRQYSTTLGPIDLLTVDAKTGEYVVIEIKKGRTADKVYGQCSRYMGWVRKNLAEPAAKVHGVIVARKIDEKLKAARDAHDTNVHLIEFEMKIGATAV